MATTIQLVVAGALLLAWVWVLGRPLVGRGGTRSGDFRALDEAAFDDGEEGGFPPAFKPRRGVRVRRFIAGWRGRPIELKRRQSMLATMFATFASFLLAIALRGRFLQLFLLMVVGLVIHLVVANWIGRRLVAEQRTEVVARAKARMTARAEGALIRAPRAMGDDSFDRAVEFASLLADDSPGDTVGITSFVSDLIDLEWAGAAPNPAPVPAAEAPAASTTAEPEPELAEPEVSTDEPEAGSEGAQPASEPIFIRAAKDVPARSRRSAQPIHIQSQLDDDEAFATPKAVNHP